MVGVVSMAQETKVALVAGLGFVICFAVVLSNRGRESRMATPVSAERMNDAGRSTAEGPMTDATRIAQPPPFARPPHNFVTPESTTTRPPVTEAGSVGAAPALNTGRTDSRVDQVAYDQFDDATATGGDVTSGEPRSSDDEAAGVAAPAASPPLVPLRSRGKPPRAKVTAQQRRELERLLDEIAGPMEFAQAGDDEGASSEQERSPEDGVVPVVRRVGRTLHRGLPDVDPTVPNSSQRGVRYMVGKGDTLYKIASAAYGLKSAKIVNAIYEANRTVMPSPGALTIGQELLLPYVPGFDAPRVVGTAAAPKSSPRRQPATGRPFEEGAGKTRWYQVKKNDRYVSIAREQLGDAARWREIYELNKHKFPEPDRIRDGVRIRLPVASAADSTER